MFERHEVSRSLTSHTNAHMCGFTRKCVGDFKCERTEHTGGTHYIKNNLG